MQSPNEITYLFGAGASYQSMPLVGSFCDRLNIYLDFLRRIGSKQSFIDHNKDLLRAVKSHLSFDTYFKKLFHQKDQQISIDRGKYLIYMYFLFEHLIDTNEFSEVGRKMTPSITKDFGCDPRYDALIAGLLKPLSQKSEFYWNINFLTWNYDLNLSYSLYNFLSRGVSLQSFLNTGAESTNAFNFSEQVKVVHLNGFINSIEFPGSLGCHSSSSLRERFLRLITNFGNESHVKEYTASLKFSWESIKDNGSMPNFIKEASDAIRRSRHIIVIGYSFPLYNRLFDLELLSQENLDGKYITILDPNSKEIKNLLHSDFGFPDLENPQASDFSGAPAIYTSISKESFFIPPQLFQKK